MTEAQIVVWGLLVALVFLFIYLGIWRVSDGHIKVVERFKKRHRVLRPGINIIIPIIDRINNDISIETIVPDNPNKSLFDAKKGLSMAEQRMDPPSRNLMAADNSEIQVDPVVYFRIVDPMKIVYDINDFRGSFDTLITTTLRQEIGRYDGDTVLTARETLSDALKVALEEATSSWGVTVSRVEIESLKFVNEGVQDALSRARAEELTRREDLIATKAAAEQEVLKAEAEKKAAILRAEGVKEAEILRAQGEYEAKKLEAEAAFLLQSREQEGVAQGFKAISEALRENPDAIVSLEALKAQVEVARGLGESNSSLIVPAETAGLFGAMSSILRGLDVAKGNKKSITDGGD